MNKNIMGLAVGGIVMLTASTALALPSLQLGINGGVYDTATETWVTTTSPAQIQAYANATKANGGNGKYAWKTESEARTAYLVIAAAPSQGSGPGGDLFDVTTGMTFVTGGYGNPPVEDTNSLSPHGIYDSYFEIYSFVFGGAIGDIGNTQPGSAATDVGKGYVENLSISVNSIDAALTGLHFDLYTVDSSKATLTSDNKYVYAFAPYSHDAEWEQVPEPMTLGLMGLGLAGVGLLVRRRRRI